MGEVIIGALKAPPWSIEHQRRVAGALVVVASVAGRFNFISPEYMTLGLTSQLSNDS
jgi:hypothetical protein